jgi:hypothetical protein
MKKQLLIFPLLGLGFLLMSCHSMPVATPDPFYQNSRVEFRNLIMPNSSSVKQVSIFKNKQRRLQQVAFNRQIGTSGYGASLDDGFNGVSEPVNLPVQQAMANLPSVHPATSVGAAPVVAPNTTPPPNLAAPGTTYIPLTFPVPPPKAMMQQFHMQVGQ